MPPGDDLHVALRADSRRASLRVAACPDSATVAHNHRSRQGGGQSERSAMHSSVVVLGGHRSRSNTACASRGWRLE